jgi:small subunit ribosomal protein S4
MIKYTGPRIRVTRRLGILPGFTRKLSDKTTTPGQHGKIFFRRSKRTTLEDDYKERLIQKQKVRYNYGISEKQLISYYKEAKRKQGSTGNLLLELIESRLDCLVYRLGFASTIPAARQLINHGHILVNKKSVNIPSFLCRKDDLISVKEKESSKLLVSNFLTVIEQRRKVLLRRQKSIIQRKISRFSKRKVGNLDLRKILKKTIPVRDLLPEHLTLDAENFSGRIVGNIKRNDISLRINELKIIEYYSR